MKKCNRCLTEKEDSCFPKDKERLYSLCKDCKNAAKREWYSNGGNKWESSYKKYVKDFKTEKYLLKKAQVRAKNKNIPIDITVDDIIIPECCPILGIKLFSGINIACDNSPTIDRIKPELGYVKGNIQVLSYRANMLKSNATIEELEKVLEHLKKMV